jgi:hypothetical protein
MYGMPIETDNEEVDDQEEDDEVGMYEQMIKYSQLC